MIKRTARCKATRDTIWRTCFQDVTKWPEWDPDLKEVTDASGECVDGTTMTFHMADGGGPFFMKCASVSINNHLEFTGRFLLGFAGAKGTFDLKDTAKSTSAIPETEVVYTFGLTGVLGAIFGSLNKKGITKGVEEGLENIIAMSEAAQGKE
ncbi:hypothetical protein HOP50_19g84920 [Chloropicon primus]|uniref:Polyketide cyclase/dehydrase n=1 Tax=Chloropicon primus TaxID=1764295 RepID=A0A5B8MZF3_9CHLO|nr:hypothetical protein A3770_19p84610 [Chloropicon primus]UPR05144.1 hypothetical protein HOP50_19g84920 [Chloropicon primus]|eukprot:QDZ25943.1 hypothetical protein A3770_19p84610 [Chloropicon primus]